MVIKPVALHSLQSASHNATSLLSLAFQAGMHRQGEARGKEGENCSVEAFRASQIKKLQLPI